MLLSEVAEMDPGYIPPHIVEQLVDMMKEVLDSKQFTDPMDAALYVTREADLSGLEDEKVLMRVANNVKKAAGY
jgi:hypothetical protein